MPWKEVTVMQQKRIFIEKYLEQTHTMSQLCSLFSISRKTGYQLIKRYEQEGISCVKPRSKRPHHSPNKTCEQLTSLILSVRDKHNRWGGDKIRRYLSTQGYIDLPSTKTINAILKRYGRITESESEKHRAWQRFEHEHPNDLWQIDFKGHYSLEDKTRCYPLTLLDDHSRFCLLVQGCTNQRRMTVQAALTEVFRRYGLPKKMTMDNGTPWGYSRDQQHTQLCAWLMRLGIEVRHSRPNHPQTQGKLERFHRTLKEELLSAYRFDNLSHMQEGFDWWVNVYNFERPHAAIDLDTPSSRFKASSRAFLETLPDIEYPEGMSVCKVSQNGLITLNKKRYKVGEGFRGEAIGLVYEEQNLASVFYCKQKILTLDLNNYV